MPTYVHNGSGWQELTGTDRPYVHAGGSFQGVTNIYAHNGSGWQQVYQYDNTGPTGGGISSISWNQSLPGFTVNYASVSDSESGVASYKLQYSSNNSSWSDVTTGLSTGGGSHSYTVTSGNRGTLHYFRTVAQDNAGNTSSSASSSKYAKPLGTFYVTATGHGIWASAGSGSWRSDLGAVGEIFHGWFNTTYAYQYGHWFYGSGVDAVAKGYAPDSGTIRTYRSSSTGCTGDRVSFATHNYGSQPSGTPSLDRTNYFNDGEQSQGNAKEYALSSGALNRIALDTNFGVFMFPGTSIGGLDNTQATTCGTNTTYRVFDSPFVDANSGRLTLVFN